MKKKTIKAKNAQVYFVLSLNQMLNGLIPARVLCDSLRKLRSLIAQNSALYHTSVRKTSVGNFESREFPEVACVPYTK